LRNELLPGGVYECFPTSVLTESGNKGISQLLVEAPLAIINMVKI